MQFGNTLFIIISMETNILSPIALWADYDPGAVKLKANFLKYETDERGVVDFEVYLSCDTNTEKETPLIYCTGSIPKANYKNATIIYINGFNTFKLEEMYDRFIPTGYGIVTFDYLGISDREHYTIYPESLKFANYIYCEDHLYSYVNSPKDSCSYVWSKMCRNVITFIKKFLGEDNKIYLRSSNEGGHIAWPVAGMDNRVEGLITTNNAGWFKLKGIFRFLETAQEYDFSEESLRWMSSCSPQAHAKFVSCPVLYLSGTNTDLTTIDRVDKTLDLTVNDGNNRVCLCANLTNTLNASARDTLANWLDNVYEGTIMPQTPSVSFEVDDGAVYARMDYDDSLEIEKLTIFYSYNEINSEFRHWDRILVSSNNPMTQIDVRYGDTRIFAFASVRYKGGLHFTSLPQMLNLTKYKVNMVAPKHTRIIYERKQGLNAWAVDNITGASYMPELKTGAYDILGVTAFKGDLSTFYIADKNFERTETSILQFDCYSEKERILEVELSVEANDFAYDHYRVSIKLTGGEWQKISLAHADFKTSELVALKNWDRVKKLSFIDIDNTLINNLIWI